MNQQLLDYISEQLQAGLSYQDIESALLGAGWDAGEVKQALASFASKQNGMSQDTATVSTQPVSVQPIEPPITQSSPVQTEAVQAAASPQASPAVADNSQATAADAHSDLAAVVGDVAVNKSSALPDAIAPAANQTVSPAATMQTPVQPAAATQPAAGPSYAPPTSTMDSHSAGLGINNGLPQTAPAQQFGSPAVNNSESSPGYQMPAQPAQSPSYPQYTQGYQQPAEPASYPYPQSADYSQPAAGGGLASMFSNNKKLFIIIGAAVGFLILVSVLAFVVASGNKNAKNSKSNNTTDQNNANSLTDSQVFTSERGGFSINPPKGWHAQEITSTTNDINVVISKETADKSQISSMQITVSTIQDAQASTTNLDSFVNFYKATTTQSNPLAKINEDKKLNLNGVEARLLDIDSVNDNTKVTGYMVYAIKDKRLYQVQALTFDVSSGSEAKKAMRNSIDTLKITSSQSSSTPAATPTPTP